MLVVDQVMLRASVSTWGIAPKALHLSDREYLVPQRASLDRFSRELAQDLAPLGAWRSESHDCGKFSVHAMSLIYRSHQLAAIEGGEETKRGLLFGMLWYRRDSGVAHSLNIVGLNKAGGLELNAYEPQRAGTGKELITLTSKEKASCFLCVI